METKELQLPSRIEQLVDKFDSTEELKDIMPIKVDVMCQSILQYINDTLEKNILAIIPIVRHTGNQSDFDELVEYAQKQEHWYILSIQDVPVGHSDYLTIVVTIEEPTIQARYIDALVEMINEAELELCA